MKSTKRILLWAAVMLAAIFCINLAGTLVAKYFFSAMLTPTMLGYAAKGETMLHPTLKEPDEKNKTNGLSGLVIRSILDDTRLVNSTSFAANFLFMNVKIDHSVILFERDGMSAFSSGIFADVYEEKTGESIDHMRYTVGLLSVRDFCELDCAEDIYEVLKNHPDAVMKLDSYSISDFLIQPASVTILDGSGNVIRAFDCPCSGELLHSENTYIFNDNDSKLVNDLHGFCNKMSDAYLGERKSDKIAKQLVDEVDFAKDGDAVIKSGYGFGHYISKSYDVGGDYAMIFVFDFNFMGGVILYTVIACIPITFLTFFLGRKKKNSF